MLGTIQRGEVLALLDALRSGSGTQLLAEVNLIAEFSPDFGTVLDEMAAVLHQIQLKQLVPEYETDDYAEAAAFETLVANFAAEEVQLYYQMAITGRRDLMMAPSARIGFEMTLLRMLAFRPLEKATEKSTLSGNKALVPAPEKKAMRIEAMPQIAISAAKPPPPNTDSTTPVVSSIDANSWPMFIENSGLRGPVGQLAQNSSFIALDDDILRLALKPAYEHLSTPALIAKMEELLGASLGRLIKLRFEKTHAEAVTPADIAARAKSQKQQAAEDALHNDPVVQSLVQNFGARIIADSVKPVEKGS